MNELYTYVYTKAIKKYAFHDFPEIRLAPPGGPSWRRLRWQWPRRDQSAAKRIGQTLLDSPWFSLINGKSWWRG
jgi:hypothetical protein